MKIRSRGSDYIKRTAAVLLCLIMAAFTMLPLTAYAADDEKIVTVGWYESPFNTTDQFGRRSGYAYEFQQKIAAYTGWKYEYVEGSWPDLMQMLIDGKIDMMSDISYTEERSELVLFSSYPMGTEEYYLFVSPDNTEYLSDSYTWLNGKKVGINKGSVMIDMFLAWQKKNNTDAEVVELTCTEEESVNMLQTGELDAYVTLDAYGGSNKSVPLAKVGSSDFFFAVRKTRHDLIKELNSAMSRIQDENRFYAQQLYDKYVSVSGANVFLSAGEKNWLSRHGTIRVGYSDNYLPFCDKDDKTGKLTGALKDYLEYSSNCFENAHLDFEPVAYPTSEAAMEAMKNGEVDCVFPSNLSTSDGETHDVFMTPEMMRTQIYAVIRKADQSTFNDKTQVTAAVEEGDINYSSVVMDNFPEWETAEYQDMKACLKAVKNGKADCVLISNYQYSIIGDMCNRYKLTPISTGKEIKFYIAVGCGNKVLYSILTRTTGLVNGSATNAALTYYSSDESRTNIIDFIKANPMIDVAFTFVIIALIAVIIAQNRLIRAKKDAEETHHQVDDLNKRVYVDALTSVRNKGAFDGYIKGLQKRLDAGEKLEVAIAIFDCNELKTINDQYGHDKGDIYLQKSANQICSVFKRSPVFRIGGDEFVVVMQNEDFQNRETLREQFEKNTEEIRANEEDRWKKVSIAMGIADYDPQTDRYLSDTVRRADKNMYMNKHLYKESN